MTQEMDMIYLMAQISHEIRTPLNGIKGFGELLLDESIGELNEMQKKYLTKMLDNTDKLTDIVDQVLEWAKLESKQSELEIEEVNFNFILWEVVDLLRDKAIAKDIELSLEAENDLLIHGDNARLREIVLNLADNALKYTPNGGLVKIRAQKEEDYLSFSVRDSGIGISEEQMKRLFRPFSHGNKCLPGEKSSGLGLWIVKLLVDLHHGEINVESTENQGSIFEVHLPLA